MTCEAEKRPRFHIAPPGIVAKRTRARDLRGQYDKRRARGAPFVVLPRLGSNQDSSDPESDVLPVTPRGITDGKTEPVLSNGAEGDRTPDLRIANAALSHLSYSPFTDGKAERREDGKKTVNASCFPKQTTRQEVCLTGDRNVERTPCSVKSGP